MAVALDQPVADFQAQATSGQTVSLAKQGFPFELISDKDEALCQLFDVIKLKKLYGKEYMGVDRSTFLIDKDGVLRQEWRGVKVPGHVDAVLAAAQALDKA